MDDYLIEVLEKNGFSYHKHHTIYVDNLQIIHYEPLVDYIDVENFSERCGNLEWYIYINFKNNVPKEQNCGLNFDVSEYIINLHNYIYKKFDDENGFIDELHRLNSIGLTIKG